MAKQSGEASNDWLIRASQEAPSAHQRQLARVTLAEYLDFVAENRRRDVATRRSLCDMMAGMEQIGPRGYRFWDDFVLMRSGALVFAIPVLTEACRRYGRTPPDLAVPLGVDFLSHRVPQTTKWGNLQLKTPPPSVKMAGSALDRRSDGSVRIPGASAVVPAGSPSVRTAAGKLAVVLALRASRIVRAQAGAAASGDR